MSQENLAAGAAAPPTAAELGQANLRHMQDEAVDSLYVATFAAGLGLMALVMQFPDKWQFGVLGICLMFLPIGARALLGRSYLLRAWLLVLVWSLAIAAALSWFPDLPIQYLFVLPVLFVLLLIDMTPGLLMAVAASALCIAGFRSQAPGDGTAWVMSAVMLWAITALAWLSIRPMTGALAWSWQHYEEARLQADQARDNQADLKQALKDLADASANAVRLNQMLVVARHVAEDAERAKAEFVANVSHELRTPLNMIIGFSEMMLQSPKTYGRMPPALRADLEVIQRNSQHLSSLIDDVLDLSQIEAGQMALTKEHVALGEIVSSAVEAMRPLYESKGLYLRANVPNGIEVFGDRTRLREILLNLLSNAGRFTERGGVEIAATLVVQEVTVSVTDTGPGIALENQQRLFQPFYQSDNTIRRRYGGSGLGLSISKHFVELHGGRLWLESTPGKGTSFYFTLPVETGASGESTGVPYINPEWEFRQRTRPWRAPRPEVHPRLVVVEEGYTLQRLLERYLHAAEVERVGNLEEAVRALVREPAHALLINAPTLVAAVDQVSTSSILPGDTPVLVCSLPASQDAADALGADNYLIKPISRQSLLGSLDRLGIQSGTVLIVDDEPEAVRLFWRMLASSERGYRILTAENGEQALSILNQERPNAVLLDLTMPGMDGFQVLGLRQEAPWRDVPFIITSARDPSGHPVVTNAVCIMRGGGLSLAQVLRYIEVISGRLEGEPSERQAQPTAPAG